VVSVPDWSGRRVQQARAHMATRLPAPCGAEHHAPDCPGTITREADPGTWVVGHVKSRITHPRLTWAVTNWRHEHRSCSDATGQAAVIANARAQVLEELRRAGVELPADPPVFPHDSAPPEAPLLPFSLPEHRPRPRVTSASKAAPVASSREPLTIRDALAWDADRVRSFPWLAEFADVPADASPPLAMTYPTDEAVGSYGAEIIAWAEEEHGITYRWWQRLAIVRQHEHRADGSLIWSEVDESAPRRSGKSKRIVAVATWRISHADVIGEVQTVIHTGNDLPICREIQRGAWRWADTKWGKGAVTQANGKEAIENTSDGSRWLVRSQGGVYGFDAGLGVGDECWDIKTDTITEGLEPAALERLWSQIHLTSTAHRRATSLMPSKISAALAEDDGRTLLLLWGALPQDDPGDPETWRKASPHWSEDRRQMIASKYEKALLGEADPQADDPDPMEGFRAQYLNVWSLNSAVRERGTAIVDKAAWAELTIPAPTRTADAVAVESWFDSGASVAFAWRLDDGGAAVRVVDVPDLDNAATAISAAGYSGQVIVGASLVGDPALRGLRLVKGQGRVLPSVLELSRLLAEAQLAHDGSPILTAQVLALRTVPGTDGPRLASSGRADAVKAAVWAAGAARGKRKPRKARLLVASAS
jgi:hypothetical protein